LPRRFAILQVVLLTTLAFAVGGCSSSMFDKGAGQSWFSQPLNIFHQPDWAKNSNVKASDMDTGGPVGPDELVGADGRCAPAVAQAQEPQTAAPAAPQPPANDAIGGMAGELGSEPAPASPPSTPGANANTPAVLGGIALGMTECQTVRRAGTPANVNISAGNQGQRQVVLTYLSGPWPGIYQFADGRLKEIDAAPLPPAPAKPEPKKKAVKKKKPAPAKTSQRAFETVQ